MLGPNTQRSPAVAGERGEYLAPGLLRSISVSELLRYSETLLKGLGGRRMIKKPRKMLSE